MARADRYGRPLCLAVLDVDDFKHLNDRLGHQAGDLALVHLARIVRRSIRPTDVISRYGGEEFVILLPETPLNDAISVMTRVQRELTKRIFLHNNERVLITFSAGVAERAFGENQEELIARADRALYHAKQAGKNRVSGSE
jgi:diguanylate cyclase